jgi:hypothetical protein
MPRQIPASPEELTAEWLTDVLRSGGHLEDSAVVTSFEAERIGEGEGFVGLIARLRLRYDRNSAGAPPTLIAKFPSPDEGARTVARLYGLYEREVRFYSDIADKAGLRTARCYLSTMDVDSDRYLLLLEDLAASGRIGNQVLGCSAGEAQLAVGELAKFHAAWWESPRLEQIGWLPRGTDLVRASMQALYPQVWKQFMQLYGDWVPPEIAGVVEGLGERVLAMLEPLDESPDTIVHADYRLDNMFFGDAGAPYRLAVFDWQAPNRGAGAYDLAYFLGSSIAPEHRRSAETQLIEQYHELLLLGGVRDYPLERLLEDYRRSLVIALAIMVVSGVTLEWTNDRAVELGEAIFSRLVDAIIDNNALEMLPD